MVKVKICGLCRPEDASLAADARADYLGVILAPGGRRSQTVDSAARIYAAAPGVRRVGVFVDAAPDLVRATAERLELDVVQLHGDEVPEQVAELRGHPWRVWKVIRPRSAAEVLEGAERFEGLADAILLDGWSASAPGGTGTAFPWAEVAEVRGRLPAGLELAIAGGLGPLNVAEAIARLAPDIVDVSSGVESAIGVKDPILVRGFATAARAAAPSTAYDRAGTGRGLDTIE